MSLIARLYIQGHASEKNGLRVLECDFKFSQETDKRGAPVAEVEAGRFNVLISTENDGELLSWMLNTSIKNGKIIYTGMQNGKAVKTVEFKDAALVFYHEKFQEHRSTTIALTISARKINITGVTFENIWSK
jgi:hypothetical protein